MSMPCSRSHNSLLAVLTPLTYYLSVWAIQEKSLKGPLILGQQAQRQLAEWVAGEPVIRSMSFVMANSIRG